jgi:hypothetical protein
MSDDEHSVGESAKAVRGNSGFLGVWFQMINQNPDSSFVVGCKLGKTFGKVIDALQEFDNNAFNSKIGTPHLLDQLRVMLSFNPDP